MRHLFFMKSIVLGIFLLIQLAQAKNDSQAWKSPVASSCYLEEFRPEDFPWKEDKCLNYEEVFKNHQYIETSVSKQTKVLTVKTYKQGQVVETKTYLIQDNLKLKPL
ncbi:MAG: hypothetical protein BroJett040_20230 [Oligoflexia bacterium]|nr:MAG: hypothetical protein BroJett040_20230 [Oligoflexia bacterium]